MTDDALIDTTGGVLTITWNRPDRLNSLTASMLHAAADAIEGAPEGVRLAVVTGTGRAFSSGAALGPDFDGTATLEGAHRLIRVVTGSHLPVLAAVNGLAAGVGCSIAAAADVTVAKQSAYFLLAFVNIGLMPDGGATELIAASVGRARANAMAMLGERLPADEAARIGLIHASIDDDSFDDEVAKLVGTLGRGPTRAYSAMKKVITANTLPRLDAALDEEFAGQLELIASVDGREGGMAFVQKRPAEFTGR